MWNSVFSALTASNNIQMDIYKVSKPAGPEYTLLKSGVCFKDSQDRELLVFP